jgi:hypothetical protein
VGLSLQEVDLQASAPLEGGVPLLEGGPEQEPDWLAEYAASQAVPVATQSQMLMFAQPQRFLVGLRQGAACMAGGEAKVESLARGGPASTPRRRPTTRDAKVHGRRAPCTHLHLSVLSSLPFCVSGDFSWLG